MKGINSTLILLLIGLLSGILLAPAFNLSLITSLISFGVALVLFSTNHFILKRNFTKNYISSILAFSVFVCIGLIEVDLTNPLRNTKHYLKQTAYNTETLLKLKVLEILKQGFYDGNVIAGVDEINKKNSSGKIILNVLKDSLNPGTALQVDDVLYAKTQLLEINPPSAPYQFNYKEYLESQGVYAQVNLKPFEFLKTKPIKHSAKGLASLLRNQINKRLEPYDFSTNSKAIFNALLLGQRQDLSNELKADYIHAGVIHILAVSGLHVGILMLILQFILRALGNYRSSRIIRTAVIIAGIWCFAFITGFSPSVLRAATMFTFVQLGLLLNQRQAGLNALITSAFILLLIQPQLIYEVGFQLSYAAVFFIMWLYPKFNALWEPKNKIVKYYWQLILVSIAAQLGVLPLSLYYFHQFPGMFLVANLVVLPAIGFLLIYGLLIILLSALNLLPQFLATGFDIVITWLNRFISFIAEIDFLLLKNIYFSAVLVVLTYLVISSAGILFDKVTFKRTTLFLSTMIALPVALIATNYIQAKSEFYVNHRYQKTIFTQKTPTRTLVFYSAEAEDIPPGFIENFKENQLITEVKNDSLGSIFTHSKNTILRIDSLAIYNIEGLNPDYILLTQSPKLNLNRLLSRYPNAKIIADGSNYKSSVDRWKLTCEQQKIPFHNTYEKGFYKIE